MRDAVSRNNSNFKHLKFALALNTDDVVAICAIGNLSVSTDRVRRWARSIESGRGRYTVMLDAEFDAFCAGLAIWCNEAEETAAPHPK